MKSAKAKVKPAEPRQQCAAIPFVRQPDGSIQILLVTSRTTKRWLVPKGWIAPSRSPAEAAAKEAAEEAGIIGKIVSDEPTGSYRYEKTLRSGRKVVCQVSVFLLRVERQLLTWPEKNQRRLQWVTPLEAVALVQEPELAEIIERLQFDTVA